MFLFMETPIPRAFQKTIGAGRRLMSTIPKHCNNNNQDENGSLNKLVFNNVNLSSHKFRQKID